VSAPVTPERLRLAGRGARVIKENGPLRDTDLLALLGCDPDELRAAIGIMIRWRKVDRCGDFLVAAPSREGRPAV
jgi:hypothetical protein